MGDITGRPKAPSQQVVYVPQYVYQTPSTGTGNNIGSGNDDTENVPETPTQAEQREKNLLSRSRSRIGTIITGFRGILAPLENNSQRKTLLGE